MYQFEPIWPFKGGAYIIVRLLGGQDIVDFRCNFELLTNVICIVIYIEFL